MPAISPRSLMDRVSTNCKFELGGIKAFKSTIEPFSQRNVCTTLPSQENDWTGSRTFCDWFLVDWPNPRWRRAHTLPLATDLRGAVAALLVASVPGTSTRIR